MLFLFHFAFAAPCEVTSTSQELQETVRLVEKAFADSDRTVLLERRDQLVAQLTCLGEPLDDVTIGRVHWAQTLGAFVQARPDDLVGAPDDSRTMAAMAGLFDVEAGFQFPLDLPPDHTLRQLRTNAAFRMKEPAIGRLPSPGAGRIEANQQPVTMLREQVAVVLQQFDGNNNLLATCYWWPGEGEGCLRDLGPVPGGRKPGQGEPDPKKTTALPWITGGLSLAAIGGGVGLLAHQAPDWEPFFGDCLGKLPLIPAPYPGGTCNYDSEAIGKSSYQLWSAGWLGGLGLITAGTLGLVGSGVVVFTDGRQVVVIGEF